MAYVGYEGYDTVVEDNQIYLKAKAEYEDDVEQYDKETKAREKQIKQKAKAEAELQQAKIEETQKYEETFANETKIYEKKIEEEQKAFKASVDSYIADTKKQSDDTYNQQMEAYTKQQDYISTFSKKSSVSSGEWEEFLSDRPVVAHAGAGSGKRPANREKSTDDSIKKHLAEGTAPPEFVTGVRGRDEASNVYTAFKQQVITDIKKEKAKSTIADAKAYGFEFSPYKHGKDSGRMFGDPKKYGIKNRVSPTKGSRFTQKSLAYAFAQQDVMRGDISITEYQSRIAGADVKFQKQHDQWFSRVVATARTNLHNKIMPDENKKWDAVAKTYSTAKATQDKKDATTKQNQQFLDKQKLNINVSQLNESGVSSMYNTFPLTDSSWKVKAPVKKEFPSSYNSQGDNVITSPQIDSKSYIVDQPKKGNQKVQAENMKQKIYTNELRKGNVGLATALLQPQTTQKYFGKDTRNLKSYLTSMGYDINNPDSIPDSVLMNPTKYRSGKTNDDGTFFVKKPMISTEVSQKRATARAKWEGVIIPDAPVEPIFATPKQKVSKVSVAGSADLPSWTFNGEKFTDKSKLDAYVATRKQQAQFNSDKKILNYIPNKTGKLNPEGYIKGYKEPERVKDRVLSVEDIKPATWTFDGKTFTDKSELTAYVENRTSQAQFNSDKNKLLNIQSNISGSLNPEGYIKGYKEPERAKDRLFSVEDIKPTSWTFDGKTFTDKSELIAHVENRTSQAQFNSDKNKLFNIQSNITGSLNPEGYIKDYKEPERAKDRLFSTSDIKPATWTFDGKTFTDKSELNEYVLSSKSQGVLNSSENKLLNTQSNISGSLNPEGYIKGYSEPEKAKDRLFSVEDIKPTTWTFKGKQFNSESELNEYVLSSKSQGVLNSSENKLLNTQSNTSGNLNSGYIEPLMGEGYNSNPVLNKPNKSATPTIAPSKTDSTNIPSNYSGDIFSVTNPLTGVTKQFRKESRAQEHLAFVNKEIEKDWDKNNPLPAEPQYQYLVQFGGESTTIIDSQGKETKVQAPVEHVFDTEEEAQSFSLAVGSVMKQPNVDDFMFANYATSVDRGTIPPPKSLIEHGLYHASGIVGVPIGNLRKTIGGLVDPEQKYVKDAPTGGMEPTFLEHTIGGTVDDVFKGTPLKFTGVTSGINYVIDDPMRTVKQVPAMYTEFASGNAYLKPVTSVTGRVIKKGITAGTNAGFKVIESNVPTILKVPVIAGMGVASNTKAVVNVVAVGVAKGIAVPKTVAYQAGTRVAIKTDKVFKTVSQKTVEYADNNPQSLVKIPVRLGVDFKSNLFKIDKKLNVIDNTRVGLKLKAELLYTTDGKELRSVTLERGKILTQSYEEYIKMNPKTIPEKNLMKRFEQSMDYAYYDKHTSSIYLAQNDGKIYGVAIDMGNTVKTKPHLADPKNYYRALDDLKKYQEWTHLAWRAKGQQLPTASLRDYYFQDSSVKATTFFKNAEINYALKKSEIEAKFGKMVGGGKTVRQPLQTLYTDNVGNLAQSDSVLIQTTKLPKGITGERKIKELMFEVPMTKNNRGIVETMLREEKLQPIGQESKSLLPTRKQGVQKIFTLDDNATAQLGKTDVDFTTSRTTIYQGDMSPIIKPKVEKIRPDFVKPKEATDSQKLETIINADLFKKYPQFKLDPLKEIYHKKSTSETGSSYNGFNNTSSTKNYGSQQILDITDEVIVPNYKLPRAPKVPTGTGKVKDFIEGRGGAIAKRNSLPTIKTIPASKSAVVGSAIVSTGIKSASGLKSSISTGLKIQQESKLDTGLKTDQGIKNIMKDRIKIKQDSGFKLSTSLATEQKQVQAQAFMIPRVIISRTKRPAGVVIPWGQNQTKTQRKPRKRGKKAGFIGNVRADSIVGVYKRADITYGKKRVSKLERQDKRLSKKAQTRIDGDMTLFKTKKKKVKKTESLLGHTFKKSKDEITLGKQKGSKGKRVKASLF